MRFVDILMRRLLVIYAGICSINFMQNKWNQFLFYIRRICIRRIFLNKHYHINKFKTSIKMQWKYKICLILFLILIYQEINGQKVFCRSNNNKIFFNLNHL